MKRKIGTFLLAVLLCAVLAIPAFAADGYLLDDADLLSKSEERELQAQLDQLCDEFDADIVIVTVETTGRYDPEDYIELFYEENGYGQGRDRDGVMLLVAMEERTYLILANGWCDNAIDPNRMIDAMQEDMGDGDYARAFKTFLDKSRYYMDGYFNGFPFDFGKNLLISLIAGLVVALIVTGIMRSKLKSVRKQHTANQYTKPGSMQVTRATDLYLYSNVTRVRKAQSSSGSRGGGRTIASGRF